MAVLLKNLYSIINSKTDAKDAERSFTFIEFIKEFGYDNSPTSFLNDYKKYLTLWNEKKNNTTTLSDAEFIRQNLIDTLKSIVLTYSSYEEQDFIANIDWEDELHRKAIIPFFAEKIKKLCDFYKNKREEAAFIINKNNFKGSRASIEQIIYDKIVDFYFENRNLKPQIQDLQNNLSITLEQYVDVYSEYFDIPRNKELGNSSREKFITANMNTPNYKEYLELAEVVSGLLFDGEVYLEEIPLIAQAALDFSQDCAGDVAVLRDTLLNQATINLISLNEQVRLKRKLYEKFLGCDLYYIYCEDKNNIQFDILAKALNPSGNLLNCGTADTAVVESDNLVLLSRIGLFFKPDKTGILKINADNFTWEIDKSKLTDDTFYIFPDPNKYGDIGNNKSSVYPLMYEYKLDSYIKNISSGYAKDEPLIYVSGTSWNTYYSAQDRDFILDKNQDFSYSFTSLMNKGIIGDYQKDIFGNEYGIFKGYREDDTTIFVPKKFKLPTVQSMPGGKSSEYTKEGKRNVLLNGGYFVDPRIESLPAAKFPEDEFVRMSDDYAWTTISLKGNSFNIPDTLIPSLASSLSLGGFGNSKKLKYIDHYGFNEVYYSSISPSTEYVSYVNNDEFETKQIIKFLNSTTTKTVIEEDSNFSDLHNEYGILYIKEMGQYPREFKPSYNNAEIINDIIRVRRFGIFTDILILEAEVNGQEKILFYHCDISDGTKYYEIESIDIGENDTYKVLFNEKDNTLDIAILSQYYSEINPRNIPQFKEYNKTNLILKRFDISNKKLEEIVNVFEDGTYLISNFIYNSNHGKIKDLVFTYNNELDTYLLVYLINNNSYPYIYQHQFRLANKEQFYATLNTQHIFDSNIQIKHIFENVLNEQSNKFFKVIESWPTSI